MSPEKTQTNGLLINWCSGGPECLGEALSNRIESSERLALALKGVDGTRLKKKQLDVYVIHCYQNSSKLGSVL